MVLRSFDTSKKWAKIIRFPKHVEQRMRPVLFMYLRNDFLSELGWKKGSERVWCRIFKSHIVIYEYDVRRETCVTIPREKRGWVFLQSGIRPVFMSRIMEKLKRIVFKFIQFGKSGWIVTNFSIEFEDILIPGKLT